MILRIFIVVGVCLIKLSCGSLTSREFETNIEPMCFKLDANDNPLINGQENPLPQTLENFIALAEKFEILNSQIGLKNELFYFLRKYSYDNIEFTSLGDIIRWEPKQSKLTDLKTLWEPDEVERIREPDARDPFTDDEKCSLFYMITHSIIREPRKNNVQRSATNNTNQFYSNENYRNFNLDDQYPMEQGVVSIRGTSVSVALGRVLRGMYVGLKSENERKKDIKDFPRVPPTEIPDQGNIIDPLYTLTVAEVIALATWRAEHDDRYKLAHDGRWVSAPIGSDLDTKAICPMIYRLNDGTRSAFSWSSLRGAADGFILGKIIDTIERKNRNVRLSQILRMYYSRNGIIEKDGELNSVWASFCNRENILGSVEQTLKEQTFLYQLLVTNSYKNIQENLDFAWKYYQEQKTGVFRNYDQALNDYCNKELTIEKPENLPLETPLDVIAVLDTSDPEFFKKQQLILGYLARDINLQYSGSRMTILTDQKVVSASSSSAGTVNLKNIVNETYSSACAACAVTQISSDETLRAPEDEVIIAIDQLLIAKKENQTNYNGVKGKVLIYFNFQAEQKTSRPTSLQAKVDRALRNLHLRHKDVSIYALGRTPELVRKYARNDGAFVMSAVDETEDIVAHKLLSKISTAPATLQYINCEDGKNENSATFEDFVTPNGIQHLSLPAKYFYKSGYMKVTFEAPTGPIRVCHNRAGPSPELQKNTCIDIAAGQKRDFTHSHPCKNFDAYSCSPLYFGVIGVNSTEGVKQEFCSDTNMENHCRTLDQFKFKVSHEGIRCSGSSAIIATPVLVLLGIILLNLISKKH